MEFPFGIALIAISVASLIWGICCAVVGGWLRFQQVSMLNDFLVTFDSAKYASISQQNVIAPNAFTEADLGSSPVTIGILAILVGVLVSTYSLVGVVGGILKNIGLMFVFIGCILVSCMLQFVIIWMLLDKNSAFHESAKDDLVGRVEEHYRLGPKAENFAQVLNSIMVRAECCGISHSAEFKNLTYVSKSKGRSYKLKVPPSCCKKKVWDLALSARDDTGLIRCGEMAGSDIYKVGCYDRIFEIAYKSVMGTYVILLFVIIVWQCLAMAVAVLILFQPKEEERPVIEAPPPVVKQEEIVVEKVEKRVFTPFSKISSFQHQDVTRMKSTEIW